jgi:hypothetical protein
MIIEARAAFHPGAPAAEPDVVPAETLFPTWRGRQSYAGRLREVADALMARHHGLSQALDNLPFGRFEAEW